MYQKMIFIDGHLLYPSVFLAPYYFTLSDQIFMNIKILRFIKPGVSEDNCGVYVLQIHFI